MTDEMTAGEAREALDDLLFDHHPISVFDERVIERRGCMCGQWRSDRSPITYERHVAATILTAGWRPPMAADEAAACECEFGMHCDSCRSRGRGYMDAAAPAPVAGDVREAVLDRLAAEAVTHEQCDASREDTYGNETERVGCMCGGWEWDANADPDEIDREFEAHVRAGLDVALATEVQHG